VATLAIAPRPAARQANCGEPGRRGAWRRAAGGPRYFDQNRRRDPKRRRLRKPQLHQKPVFPGSRKAMGQKTRRRLAMVSMARQLLIVPVWLGVLTSSVSSGSTTFPTGQECTPTVRWCFGARLTKHWARLGIVEKGSRTPLAAARSPRGTLAYPCGGGTYSWTSWFG